jgi:hypothetical protein
MHPRSTRNWHFLATDASTIDALSDNLGFLFYPSAKGFDHLVQTTIIDRNGVIYRQLYGVDLDTQALVEPLKELVFDTPRSAGLIEHWISTFKLFCTVYDPNSDRYRFDYSIFMTIVVGVLCLGAIATFIVREWRSRPLQHVRQGRTRIRIRIRSALQPVHLARRPRLVFLLDNGSNRHLPVHLLRYRRIC